MSSTPEHLTASEEVFFGTDIPHLSLEQDSDWLTLAMAARNVAVDGDYIAASNKMLEILSRTPNPYAPKLGQMSISFDYNAGTHTISRQSCFAKMGWTSPENPLARHLKRQSNKGLPNPTNVIAIFRTVYENVGAEFVDVIASSNAHPLFFPHSRLNDRLLTLKNAGINPADALLYSFPSVLRFDPHGEKFVESARAAIAQRSAAAERVEPVYTTRLAKAAIDSPREPAAIEPVYADFSTLLELDARQIQTACPELPTLAPDAIATILETLETSLEPPTLRKLLFMVRDHTASS